ncbi:MAG TPA: hypothetical protein QF517_00275 [Pseudomonadales bacterium]|nr:hypothetical protein [Pseudomonadales bacterium]
MKYTAILLLIALFTCSSLQASPLDYLFQDLDFSDEHLTSSHELLTSSHELLTSSHELLIGQISNSAYDEARATAKKLVSEVSDSDLDSLILAKVLANSAIIELNWDLEEAINIVNQAIDLTEIINPFHKDLFGMLLIRAFAEEKLGDHTSTTDTLRRAQHISHRHDGVYTRDQLPIIKSLALINEDRGRLESADREQRFRLKISEQAYGVNAEELIPTLEELGIYFAKRGYSIPGILGQTDMNRIKLFRFSFKMYERAIAIIEDKYGPNDLRLVSPLKGLSKAKFLLGSAKTNSRSAMERATEIISNNPTTDTPDFARAIIDLADIYTMTQDSRAYETYQHAWVLLSEKPEYEQLRYDAFAKPKWLHHDDFRPVLKRQPVGIDESTELFVEVEFDDLENGSVKNVEIIESNVPNDKKKSFRDSVRRIKYRPRLVDGNPRVTEGLSLYQTFVVHRPEPTVETTSETGPET